MSNKAYLPVLRDNIEGNRLIEKPIYVKNVMDTIEFQRLRNIRQMGLASYVFPTAEHTRFSHSLGVLANAQYSYKHLQSNSRDQNLNLPGLRFDQHSEIDFCISAMCHDIGHTSFSHALESMLLPSNFRNHEDCTIALLLDNTELSKEVRNFADIEAVVALIGSKHANPALNELISGAFDVDRCDYVIRDSNMSGVEYGQFDLKWLMRALKIELNPTGRPILVLDGPRGIDALRQFLSARRYMHRQVYYHSSVRSSQILLRSILERIQDIGPDRTLNPLIPGPLRCLMRGNRPSLSDFIDTTDAEVLTMIRTISNSEHKDEVLKYLCQSFIKRYIPKCILDSSILTDSISHRYNINESPLDGSAPIQETLPLIFPSPEDVIDELREFVKIQLEQSGFPGDICKYLVKFDVVQFSSYLPSDFRFEFGTAVVSYDEISSDVVGFNIESLLESFTMQRLFVPRDVVGEAREFIEQNYRLN